MRWRIAIVFDVGEKSQKKRQSLLPYLTKRKYFGLTGDDVVSNAAKIHLVHSKTQNHPTGPIHWKRLSPLLKFMKDDIVFHINKENVHWLLFTTSWPLTFKKNIKDQWLASLKTTLEKNLNLTLTWLKCSQLTFSTLCLKNDECWFLTRYILGKSKS